MALVLVLWLVLVAVCCGWCVSGAGPGSCSYHPGAQYNDPARPATPAPLLPALCPSPPVPRPCTLQNKSSEFCAPLTSFDWNDADPKRVGTASIDTTCTIWDVEKGVVDTQVGTTDTVNTF